MSGKKTQFQRLIDRCEAVGWPVRRTGKDHFFIRAPNGEAESFPSTPDSGRGRGIRNAESWCKRNGLLEAEAALAKEKDDERMRRIQRSRDTVAEVATIRSSSKADDQMEKITNKDFVNGIKVVDRYQAKIETPITHGKAVPLGGSYFLDSISTRRGAGKFTMMSLDPDTYKLGAIYGLHELTGDSTKDAAGSNQSQVEQ